MRLKAIKAGLAGTALALSLGASTAFAFDVKYTATEPALASNLLGAAGAVVNNAGTFDIVLEQGDLVVGRTTGWGVRLTLSDGLFTGSNAAGDGAAVGAGAAGWVIDPIPDADNSAILTVTVAPPAPAVGLTVGNVLQFAIGDFPVDGIQNALSIAGGSVTVTVDFFDPVTATVLLTDTATLFSSAEGVSLSSAASTVDSAHRIDVGSTNSASKTDFSTSGVINDAATNEIHVGVVSATLNGGVGGTSAAGTTYAAYAAANLLQFNAGVDVMTVTLTGDDLTPFTRDGITAAGVGAGSVRIEPGANGGACSDVGTLAEWEDGAAAVIGASTATLVGSTAVTFTFVKPTAATETFDICLETDAADATLIDDQVLSVTASIDMDPGDLVGAGGIVDPAPNTSAVSPLVFNGDVFQVHTVNPGSNTTQESFLRISSNGGTGGKVTITAIDDDGNVHPGTDVTFTLASGESVQLTAADIENGTTKTTPAGGAISGAIGDGAGKWKVTVTAEYDGLEVSSFIRTTDGFLTNITKSSAN